jgi:hypothetical protein
LIAAGAGLVLDHDRLTPFALQLLADDTGKDVVDAAAGEGDDEFHRAGGEGCLRDRGARDCCKKSDDASCREPLHATPLRDHGW